MNKMTVGMENLPNVFIDKIAIEKTGLGGGYRIQVILKMFDRADDHSWRNRVSGLKVKIALIRDERISSLNAGTISLYDVSSDSSDRVRIESCDEFGFSDRRDGYVSYTKLFQFRTLVPPTNLNVYAACFIDDLQFGIPMFDKFYGPMVGERIFVGGEPNAESGYFYNPETNEEYGGPVHQHSSGYMEGSMHRDEPHAGLRYVAEENYKLIMGTDLDTQVFDGVLTAVLANDIDLDEGSAITSPTITDPPQSAATGIVVGSTDDIDY